MCTEACTLTNQLLVCMSSTRLQSKRERDHHNDLTELEENQAKKRKTVVRAKFNCNDLSLLMLDLCITVKVYHKNVLMYLSVG